VNYATSNASAVSGSDYQATSGVLSIPANTTTGTITVPVFGDTIRETNETFNVKLTSPTNSSISDNLGVGTIANDDPLPSLSVNDVTVTEGNSGTVNAAFTITQSAVSGLSTKVKLVTANGTALSGKKDYVSKTVTVTIPPGSTSVIVNVTVNGDTLVEGNETFFVNLSSPVNATISDAQGIGTILNDD
jgi:large repetitive protein